MGAVVGDRYRIERIVGTGAMGAIYEASCGSERFAIKALPDAIGGGGAEAEERRARFLREAAVCETIRHPHVVPVLAHGIDRSHDVPYFVMPLLDGEDMAKLLDRVGHLDPGVAGALFVQACDGLTAVHARGVVHRDVKPSNLFLVRDGDRTILKVTDFGLAKVYGDDLGTLALTATGRFMGTPHYVSPEQAVSAKHVDARGDVFSLAMSLYHALSGAPAFSYAKSFMKLVLEITSREAPPLEDTAPWLPPGLVRVVHGALLRDPAARCPSAGELSLALESVLGIDVARRPVGWDALRPPAVDPARSSRERTELPLEWADVLRF